MSGSKWIKSFFIRYTSSTDVLPSIPALITSIFLLISELSKNCCKNPGIVVISDVLPEP